MESNADDRRNFRQFYYNHLGLHSVEQKKALQQLLNEDTINIDKLKIFSEEYVLPASLRPYVWKVLLNILPVFKDSLTFVAEQRQAQYRDLYQALTTMRMINDKQHVTNATLYLLEHGILNVLHPDTLDGGDCSKHEVLVCISQAVCKMIADPCDAYWITRCMFKDQDKYVAMFGKLPKYVKYYLQLEDQRLYEHLCEIQLFKLLRYDRWFSTYFTSVFKASLEHLEKIWDKLIAGSCNVLVFLFVALLLTFSIRLKEIQSPDAALELISSLPRKYAVVVVDKTIELWDQHRRSLAQELANESSEKEDQGDISSV